LQGKAPENAKDKKKRGSQGDDCVVMWNPPAIYYQTSNKNTHIQ
jgi:hypothetical protein